MQARQPRFFQHEDSFVKAFLLGAIYSASITALEQRAGVEAGSRLSGSLKRVEAGVILYVLLACLRAGAYPAAARGGLVAIGFMLGVKAGQAITMAAPSALSRMGIL